MISLYIDGLHDEGPGDIVGSFVNEADVSPNEIGEIDISEAGATVEVSDEIADRIVARMDGGTIGDSTVHVQRMTDRYQSIHSYVKTYTRLVEHERNEEMRRHKEEIKKLSGPERERKGRAILQLTGRDQGEGIAGYKVKFLRQNKNEQLPETEIRVGDLVMLSRDDPLRDDNPTGTVSEITNYSITISFDTRPPGFLFGDHIRMDLYVNDITYQRMKDALTKLPESEGSLKDLSNIFSGYGDPSSSGEKQIDDWENSHLNESQKRAVQKALGSDDIHLVHGPPGTGKTTTAVEIIQQLVTNDEFVLATAASNTAVDNLLEFLLDQDVNAVRVGHPARVITTLKDQTLDARIEEYDDYQRSRKLRERAFNRLDQQEDLTAPTGRWRRGMADDQIKSLAESGKGSRGVSAEKIQEMAEWLQLREEADELFELSDRLENQAIQDLFADVDVVCSTNSTAGSELLSDYSFDTVVIDEATQATEPSCLIPITRADKVIMAGDHRQLPPTILSQEASDGGLKRTLFERLADKYYEDIASLLTNQYRMNQTIMDFSSKTFYEGELTADESVRDHTLVDFGIADDDIESEYAPLALPSEPLVFADTVRLDSPELQRSGSTSRENPTEAQIVTSLVRLYSEVGIPGQAIAVISPYDDQVDRIRNSVDVDGLEIDTVDGFQGREKEIVIISLVRSNDRGEVGFLREERRFNVALTRARRKAIIVGDSSTICRTEIFSSFVEYSRNNATVEVL